MRDWKKFEKEERLIKDLCQKLVNEIRRVESIGYSLGISLEDTKELLDHLYTAKCDEKPVERPEDNSPKVKSPKRIHKITCINALPRALEESPLEYK